MAEITFFSNVISYFVSRILCGVIFERHIEMRKHVIFFTFCIWCVNLYRFTVAALHGTISAIGVFLIVTLLTDFDVSILMRNLQ